MVTKETIRRDDRFFIDERNIDRLMNRPVVSYTVKKMKVGMILRTRANTNRIVTLNHTRVYAFLKGDKDGEKAYEEYRKLCGYVSFRNTRTYNQLIHDIEKNAYDIRKGAIVVDQNNLILDGQHRGCILFKRYGPNYKINVVQLIYKNHDYLHLFFLFKLFVAKCTASIFCTIHSFKC